MLTGKVEAYGPLGVSGWIFSAEAGDAGVALEFLLGNVVVATTRADLFRQDLADAGYGFGRCAFKILFDPPLNAAQLEAGRLRLAGTALDLGLPRSIQIAADRGSEGRSQGLKVFIVGAPRTGTSALYSAIQKTFDLPGPGEGHLIPALSHAVHAFRTYMDRFKTVDRDVLVREFPRRGFEEVLFAFFRSFYLDRFGSAGWVDKTPSDEAVHGAVVIRTLFPDAKLIVTTRGLLETAASYRAKFGGTAEDGARVWVSVKEGVASLKRAGVDFLLIDQSELESNPDAIAHSIADYLSRPDLCTPLADNLRVRFDDESSRGVAREPTRFEDLDWTEAEKDRVREIASAHLS